jgi:predicted nucleotidyltransferase component of viral defense system
MFDLEKHKDIIIRILKDIYTNNSLGPLLGFKGGTTALLFYGLPRMSVDLDFDLLDPTKEDLVFEKIEQIILKYGKVKNKMKKHFTLFFELSYADTDRNIKVEINRRNFGSDYEILNFFGITMKVMTKKDMFANKLAAFYERAERANRDIYDVWFFLQNNWPINKNLVEKRLNISFRECLESCIKKMEKISEQGILSGMGELMDVKQKNWVKTKLKTEILFLLRVLLDKED